MVNSMRYFGVDTRRIHLPTGQMWLYYLEKGVLQMSGKVVYDRLWRLQRRRILTGKSCLKRYRLVSLDGKLTRHFRKI